MRNIILLALALLALAGCKSKEERRKEFADICLPTGFTVPQCNLLFQMKEDAEDDSNTALAIGISTGTAVSVRR